MDDRIGKWLDFSFLALIKLGAIAALVPLVLVAWRAQAHSGYRSVEAEITGSSVQCRISESAARKTGKRSHWWDCDDVGTLQRAFPNVDLDIASASFIHYRFALPNGTVRDVAAEAGFFDLSDPEPGTIVPVVYAPDNPIEVAAVLRLEHWAFFAFIGLLGLTTGVAGWWLRERREELAARLAAWLEREPEDVATFTEDWPEDEHIPGTLPTRGRDGRHLGVG